MSTFTEHRWIKGLPLDVLLGVNEQARDLLNHSTLGFSQKAIDFFTSHRESLRSQYKNHLRNHILDFNGWVVLIDPI